MGCVACGLCDLFDFAPHPRLNRLMAYEQLSGGYAAVTGFSYAVPACTSGACTRQDLDGLKAALETTPVSICVNPWLPMNRTIA